MPIINQTTISAFSAHCSRSTACPWGTPSVSCFRHVLAVPGVSWSVMSCLQDLGGTQMILRWPWPSWRSWWIVAKSRLILWLGDSSDVMSLTPVGDMAKARGCSWKRSRKEQVGGRHRWRRSVDVARKATAVPCAQHRWVHGLQTASPRSSPKALNHQQSPIPIRKESPAAWQCHWRLL